MTEVLFPEVRGNDRYALPPMLRGGIYCSPWCGGECTKVAFDLATEQAAALAERMGDGWKPRVWENLGWHWQVFKGKTRYHAGLAEIHPANDGTFSAWINSNVEGVGQVITDYFEDPIEALGLALQEARGRSLRFSAELDGISQ